MRFILFLLLLVGLFFVGLAVLDFFGYYLDWNRSVLAVTILVPVATAIRNFFSKPAKQLNKIHRQIDHD